MPGARFEDKLGLNHDSDALLINMNLALLLNH